jgi:hypothetical protein
MEPCLEAAIGIKIQEKKPVAARLTNNINGSTWIIPHGLFGLGPKIMIEIIATQKSEAEICPPHA